MRAKLGEEASALGEPPSSIDGQEDKHPTRYRQHCLEIRLVEGFCEFPAYAQLIDFFADHPENPSILLIWFLHVLVIVKGANMKDHPAGLHQRTLWIIAQYAAPPENPKALYVRSIEFVREDIPATVAMLLGEKEPKER